MLLAFLDSFQRKERKNLRYTFTVSLQIFFSPFGEIRGGYTILLIRQK